MAFCVTALRLAPALLLGFCLITLSPGAVGGSSSADGGGATTSTACGRGSNSQSDGSVDISWTAPTTDIVGNAITPNKIGGFIVYCGSSKQELSRAREINDGTATSYKVTSLPPGTYYFAVSAKDTSEYEGPKSRIVTTTVD